MFIMIEPIRHFKMHEHVLYNGKKLIPAVVKRVGRSGRWKDFYLIFGDSTDSIPNPPALRTRPRARTGMIFACLHGWWKRPMGDNRRCLGRGPF